MLETIAIPALMKAIDFLFEEGRQILRERRERREGSTEGADSTDRALSKTQDEDARPPGLPVATKSEALQLTVDEVLWEIHESRIQHLVELARISTRNYHLAKEQQAKWGSALVPPIVLSNLKEAEDAVAEVTADLTSALQRVYGDRQQPPPSGTGSPD